MLLKIEHYLPFYLGCDTDKGKIIGITQQFVMIRSAEGGVLEDRSFSVKPFLKRLDKISEQESSELINMGFSIGRPHGYSFSPAAFSFLIGLRVDLFGLIESGLAIDSDVMSLEQM